MYDAAKKDFEAFINQLIPAITKIDSTVGTLEAKDCIFRIHRDVRFSHDKTPYKPNFGAYISRGGKGANFAGYYFHIENDGSFMGGGIYMPQPNILKAIRTEIFENTAEFKKIIENKNFKKYYKEVWYGDKPEDKLKTAPKGFPKDFEYIEILKYKNFALWHDLSFEQLAKPDLLDYVTTVYSEMVAFNDFFNRVVENVD